MKQIVLAGGAAATATMISERTGDRYQGFALVPDVPVDVVPNDSIEPGVDEARAARLVEIGVAIYVVDDPAEMSARHTEARLRREAHEEKRRERIRTLNRAAEHGGVR